jgi:gamma-glutamylcyclotransferase (GGCT)/AIG2-like uncharacterized protein YtfP
MTTRRSDGGLTFFPRTHGQGGFEMADFPTPYVFLYDVFMKDCVKHVQVAANVKTWARAEMPGKLYQLPTGLPVVVEEAAPAAAAAPVEGAPPAPSAPESKVFGEVMTFEELDRIMALIDAQEGYRPEARENSRLLREVREVTVTATGQKVQAMVYLFPKEKFNAKEMYAVHAHGGDWRKFVMMPRFDGYQH